MKKLLALALVLMLALTSNAFAVGLSDRVIEVPGYYTVDVPADMITIDDEIVQTYIQEFANFTQVPRPTHHAEKMTAYLAAWADAHGLVSESDEVGNIVIWVPATEGYEDAPGVAFQGHIDMVAAVDEGYEHDFLNDPLELIWTENGVHANHTTLGADNGSGVAFMLTYADYADTFVHGPITLVFTVDEEEGMIGAKTLDPHFVADVTYLINVDSGYGGATLSCAGGNYFEMYRAAEWTAVPEGYVAYTLAFDGFKGGHSAGVGSGKANTMVALADAIVTLYQNDIEFYIADIKGGTASNAIPAKATGTIVVKESDLDAVTAVMDFFAKEFIESYSPIEVNGTFVYGVSNTAVEKVLTEEVSIKLVQLMSTIPNNIHTLRAYGGSGTECSSNLGLFWLEEDEVRIMCYMRSSNTYQRRQMELIFRNVAELTGFNFEITGSFGIWPLKENNTLADIASEVFFELTGKEYRLSITHAGLEGGEFQNKNEDMFIICTGLSGGSNGHATTEAMSFVNTKASIDYLVALAERLVTK